MALSVVPVRAAEKFVNDISQDEQDRAYCYERIPWTQWQYETFKDQVQLEKHTRERTRDRLYNHYSWTDGKPSVFNPPSWPGEGWVSNADHEPHNNATWVGDSLHYTGPWHTPSWFYLEAYWSDWSEWTQPVPYGTHFVWVDADAVPAPNWQEHGGSYTNKYQRDWALLPNGNTQQISTGFVVSDKIDGTNAPDDLHPWVQIDSGFRNGDRIPCSEQPPAETRDEIFNDVDCETQQVITTMDVFKTEYILDENFEWVPGPEVQIVDDEFVDSRPATVEELVVAECIDPEVPETPEEPPAPNPEPPAPVDPPRETLPVTGATTNLVVGGGLAMLLIGFVMRKLARLA